MCIYICRYVIYNTHTYSYIHTVTHAWAMAKYALTNWHCTPQVGRLRFGERFTHLVYCYDQFTDEQSRNCDPWICCRWLYLWIFHGEVWVSWKLRRLHDLALNRATDSIFRVINCDNHCCSESQKPGPNLCRIATSFSESCKPWCKGNPKSIAIGNPPKNMASNPNIHDWNPATVSRKKKSQRLRIVGNHSL